MGEESSEPDKKHQVSLQGSQPAARAKVSHQIFYGWDVYSTLVLSIILTGTLPLAITSGIAFGAILWNWDAISGLLAALIGLGAGVGMILVELFALCLLTRPFARRRLIPWARTLFPSSGEVASQSKGKPD